MSISSTFSSIKVLQKLIYTLNASDITNKVIDRIECIGC